MNASTQLAKHLREVFFGGNWTVSNVKEQLADVTWQQATTQVQSFNTIATLAFHISYFVSVVTKVLEGGPLEGNDKLSFAHPPINSQEDWSVSNKKYSRMLITLQTLLANCRRKSYIPIFPIRSTGSTSGTF